MARSSGAGIGGLDDALEASVRRRHQPAVWAGISGPHARYENRRRLAPPLVQQAGQCDGAQQRRVAEQHEDLRDTPRRREPIPQCAQCGADRVSGSQRRVLDDAFGRSDDAGDLARFRPDHDDGGRRRQRPQRRQRVCDHRLPGKRMQDLGQRRFHSRAVSGSEDDGGKAGWAHRRLDRKK
jgi:hypothetical protein